MPIAAKRALRCAIGVAIAASLPFVASCGSNGGFVAPFNLDGGWGIVGSGPGGGPPHGLGDGGDDLDGASGLLDSGNDAGHPEGDSGPETSTTPPVDSGITDSESLPESGTPGETGSDTDSMGGGSGADASTVDSGSGPEAGNGTDSGGSDAGASSDTGTGIDASGPSDAGDGGSSVGVTFNIPPGLFPTLTWTISGPATYSGVLHMGDAHSIEFVVGGIEQGDGYTLTLSGTDRYGGMCSGTSAPFNVQAGMVSEAAVVIDCPDPDGGSGTEAANVTTGSVGANVGVVIVGD
jgi:hypothetical protein